MTWRPMATAPRDGDICHHVLRRQPTLLEVLAMEQGRLAKHAFGAPTDRVFDVVSWRPLPAAYKSSKGKR
jgi:hypothetical protein